MDHNEHINIYEFLDQNGDPSHYICHGHVDSERFREVCYKEFSVKPMVVQHSWQKNKRVSFKDAKSRRYRTKIDRIQCSEKDLNAKAVTIGKVKRQRFQSFRTADASDQ